MRRFTRYRGFSLTEVLLAVATLATGMLFVGGTFMLAVYYSTRATEQTIAAVVAEEAVNKIRLYGLDPNDPNYAGLVRYARDREGRVVTTDQFRYPSTAGGGVEKQYAWSALCRWSDPNTESQLLQVTVFVCRAAGKVPSAEKLAISPVSGSQDQIRLTEAGAARRLYERSVLVDDATGQVYRVFQTSTAQADTVTLDRAWKGAAGAVWAVLRPLSGGRNPCITVFQTEVGMPGRSQPAAASSQRTQTVAGSAIRRAG